MCQNVNSTAQAEKNRVEFKLMTTIAAQCTLPPRGSITAHIAHIFESQMKCQQTIVRFLIVCSESASLLLSRIFENGKSRRAH